MNLAYHHIRGLIMVVGPGLARLYCTTNTDISTSWRESSTNRQWALWGPPGLGETDTVSTIRLKLIQSHQRNKQQGLDGCGPDSVDAVISLAVVLTRSLSVISRAYFRSAHYLITGDHDQISWHRVSLSSLSLLASPGLSWTQVTLKPGTSCCLALLCSLGPRLPTLSPTVLLESSEGGGSFHSSAALSRSRNPRHVQSREWPRHGAWRPVTGARAADCWYLVWVRPSLPWPKPWPGPSLVTGPAAVKLVVKISNHRISAGLESMIM